MDRTAWIAVVLCVLGLVGWEVWMTKQRMPAPGAPPAAAAPAATPALEPTAAPLAQATPSVPGLPAPTVAPFAEKTEIMRNADVELLLTNRGGGISEVKLLHYMAEKGEPVRLDSPQHFPIGATMDAPSSAALAEFAISRTENTVVLERTSPEHLTVRKSFSFAPSPGKKDDFLVALDIEFKNDGAAAFHQPPYFVALGSAAPTHPKDYAYYTRLAWCVDGKAAGIDVNWFGAQTIPIVGIQKRAAQEFYRQELPKGAEWGGVANQFFTTLITPLDARVTEIWGRRFLAGGSEAAPIYGIEGAMAMPPLDLAPGASKTLRYQIYAGPKLYARLAAMEQNQAEIMNFGIWKIVSQTLLNFMNLLHSFLGNYALAIVALTVIIKAVLWPLQNKANASMRRMSALSPKMQALKEKYKDDPTRMNQEVMKLYKEYGVNPVGGCLPMLIQIPIFFGLLSMLGQAVELRNAKFLWVQDLSQPDTVAHLPGLGWPINVLPLLMAATNLLLMRMTPKTGDTTQQRVLMFTPLIFLFFCYNFAAALALYYTTLNLLTVLQLYVNKRQPVPVLEKVGQAGRGMKRK